MINHRYPGAADLDASEGQAWVGWELNVDGAAGGDFAILEDDSHDTGPWRSGAIGVAAPGRGHQAGPKTVHLDTGCAEAGDLDDSARAEVQQRGLRQGKQIYAHGGDVLTEVTGFEIDGEGPKKIEKLAVEEVNLCQVWLTWIAASEIAMPHRGAKVGVSLHTEAADEMDVCLRRFAEGVTGAKTHAQNLGLHQRGVSVSVWDAAELVARSLKARGKVET